MFQQEQKKELSTLQDHSGNAILEAILSRKREPDFDNMLAVLNGEVPSRPTLFEFFLNDDLHLLLGGRACPTDPVDRCRLMIQAFHRTGYDWNGAHRVEAMHSVPATVFPPTCQWRTTSP